MLFVLTPQDTAESKPDLATECSIPIVATLTFAMTRAVPVYKRLAC